MYVSIWHIYHFQYNTEKRMIPEAIHAEVGFGSGVGFRSGIETKQWKQDCGDTRYNMNYRCHTGMSLGQGGGRLSLVLSGTLLPDPSFSYPREVEIWYEERGGRELIIKLRPYQP